MSSAAGLSSSPNPGSSFRSTRPLVGNTSFKKRFPKEGAIVSPSGELACQKVSASEIGSSFDVKRTHDVLAEVAVGERHDGLEGVWTRAMGYDGNIVRCGHASDED